MTAGYVTSHEYQNVETTTTGYYHAEEPKQRPKWAGAHLGIKHFKQELKVLFPNLPKSQKNKLIAAFKKRGWMEFEAIIGRKMSIGPTRRNYGKKITVSGIETKSYRYKIKVRNGQK